MPPTWWKGTATSTRIFVETGGRNHGTGQRGLGTAATGRLQLHPSSRRWAGRASTRTRPTGGGGRTGLGRVRPELGLDHGARQRGPGWRKPDGPSFSGSLSAHGRYVAFYSGASDLVEGDGNGTPTWSSGHVAGTTVRTSVDRGGGDSDGQASPLNSADGMSVAFWSRPPTWCDDGNGLPDVFLWTWWRDQRASTWTRRR